MDQLTPDNVSNPLSPRMPIGHPDLIQPTPPLQSHEEMQKESPTSTDKRDTSPHISVSYNTNAIPMKIR